MELTTVPLDSPYARALVDQVQQEYVRRYGGPDATVLASAEFAPPRGTFVVGRVDGVPVACGGWRARDAAPAEPALRDGDAELKRMFVVPAARGRGYARLVLAELERRAAAAGRRRIVLETGSRQPEAEALYGSSGYARIPGFGRYGRAEGDICFGKELGEAGAGAPVAQRAGTGH